MSERPTTDTTTESRHAFDCFGGRCTVIVADGERPADAAAAAAMARGALLRWHDRFSRFEPDSEVSALNRDPRPTVTVSPLLARLAQAACAARGTPAASSTRRWEPRSSAPAAAPRWTGRASRSRWRSAWRRHAWRPAPPRPTR